MKLISDYPSRNTIICHLANLFYLSLVKFSAMVFAVSLSSNGVMPSTSRKQPKISSVVRIARHRNIFQIISQIIQFVAVFMVDNKIFRLFTQKRRSDKLMNFESRSLFVRGNIQSQITVCCHSCFQYATNFAFTVVTFFTANISKVGNGVKIFIVGQSLPNFSGIIYISHSVFSRIENGLVRVAESVQNFWRPASILPQTQVKQYFYWKNFKDLPHVQLKGLPSYKVLLPIYNQGGLKAVWEKYKG